MTAHVFAAHQPMPPINQWVLLHPLPGGFGLLRLSKANIMAAKVSGEERKIKLVWRKIDEAPGYILSGESAVEGAMVYFVF